MICHKHSSSRGRDYDGDGDFDDDDARHDDAADADDDCDNDDARQIKSTEKKCLICDYVKAMMMLGKSKDERDKYFICDHGKKRLKQKTNKK